MLLGFFSVSRFGTLKHRPVILIVGVGELCREIFVCVCVCVCVCVWCEVSRVSPVRMLPGFLLLLIVLHVTEGCDLINHQRNSYLTAHVGDARLLPCFCSNLLTSPHNLIWRKYDKNDWKILEPNQARFQLSNAPYPGNLSLLISAVEMEDKGLYRCDTGDRYTDINLSVQGVGITAASNPTSDAFYSLIPVVLLLLLLGLAGVIVWRYKAKNRKQTASGEGPTGQKSEQEPQRNEQEPQRNEQEPQRNEQEPQRNEQERQDDVMYTTVIHTNTTQQAKALSIDDRTEYASIRLN